MEFVNQVLSTAGPPLIAIFFTSIDDTFIFFSMPGVHALSVLFAFLFFIRFKEEKNIEEDEEKNKKTLMDGVYYSYKFINIRILLILTSCGYQPIYKANENTKNININEIIYSGSLYKYSDNYDFIVNISEVISRN